MTNRRVRDPMDVTVCDRCGVERDSDMTRDSGWGRFQGELYTFGPNRGERLSPDLCPSCLRSLREWVDGLQGGTGTLYG